MPDEATDNLQENELERERRLFREREAKSPSANPGMAEILQANAAKEASGTMTPPDNDQQMEQDSQEAAGEVNATHPKIEDEDNPDVPNFLEEENANDSEQAQDDAAIDALVTREEAEEAILPENDSNTQTNEQRLKDIHAAVAAGTMTVDESINEMRKLMEESVPEVSEEEQAAAEQEQTCRHDIRGQRRTGYVMAPHPVLLNEQGLHLIRQIREVCTKCRFVEKGWDNIYVQTTSESTIANEQFAWTDEEVARWERDGEIWQNLSS